MGFYKRFEPKQEKTDFWRTRAGYEGQTTREEKEERSESEGGAEHPSDCSRQQMAGWFAHSIRRY